MERLLASLRRAARILATGVDPLAIADGDALALAWLRNPPPTPPHRTVADDCEGEPS